MLAQCWIVSLIFDAHPLPCTSDVLQSLNPVTHLSCFFFVRIEWQIRTLVFVGYVSFVESWHEGDTLRNALTRFSYLLVCICNPPPKGCQILPVF